LPSRISPALKTVTGAQPVLLSLIRQLSCEKPSLCQSSVCLVKNGILMGRYEIYPECHFDSGNGGTGSSVACVHYRWKHWTRPFAGPVTYEEGSSCVNCCEE